MSIYAIDAVTTPKAHETYLRNSQNVNFQAKATNTLERIPQQDIVEKKGMSTGGKIALGAVALTGAAALIDAVACKGKHIKQIFRGNNKTKLEEAFNKVTKTEELYYDDVYNIAKQKYKEGLIFDELHLSNPKQTIKAMTECNVEIPENPNAMMLLLTKNGEHVHSELFLPEKISSGIKDLFGKHWDDAWGYTQKVT